MQLLQGVSQSMKGVSGDSSADELTRMSSALVQVKDKVREELQVATAGDISTILEKLDKQELLTPAEKDLVGFWLVGTPRVSSKWRLISATGRRSSGA